jgi:2-dehydropantoate 2-reductase
MTKRQEFEMRILVVGAGAVGGYFGGRLLAAGRDVTFLVRPKRRDQLAAGGLVIKSAHGDASMPAPTVLAEQIAGPWDLILLSCKAYDLAGAIESFAPAVGPQTMILPLLNGMAHLDALDQRFGAERVLGGLCAIAATLSTQGEIVHLSQFHGVTFGERSGAATPRIRAIAEQMAGINATNRQSSNILLEMWEKWVLLAALAAGTCLFRASVCDIVAAGGTETMLGFLGETQAVATAAGFAARPEALERTKGILTDSGSTVAASMLRDVEKGGPTEADHVIGDLLRRGSSAKLSLPLLSTAYLHLKANEARRRRESA